MKYCDKHQIWYGYKDDCPECHKFAKVAGSIIGSAIGIAVGGAVVAGRKIKEKLKEEEKKNTNVKPNVESISEEEDDSGFFGWLIVIFLIAIQIPLWTYIFS